MKKKWIGTIGTALLAAGGVLGLASPANAAVLTTSAVPAETSNCSLYSTCTWGDRYYLTSGYGADLLGFQNCVDDYFNYDYLGTSLLAADSATSIYDHGASNDAYMFNGTYQAGNEVLALTPGEAYGQLNAEVPAANDSIESGYFSADLGAVGTSTCD